MPGSWHGPSTTSTTSTTDPETPPTRRSRAGGAAPGHATVSVADLPLERVAARPTFMRGFFGTVREIWQYRELLAQLVRKELKVKYKDSVLGFMWTLVRPLLQLLVYSIAIGVFLGSGRVIPQFGIYLFTGLIAWTLFTDIIGGCTGAIVSNGSLVKKVYFPRELFPLSVVGAALINFAFQLVVLVGAYAVTWSLPSAANLGLVPLALLALVLFATALGLILGASNVYLRDVTHLIEVTLLLWFWMTPIVYDWTKVRTQLVENNDLAWLFQVYIANPMANVVLSFQRALWPGGLTEKGEPFYYDGNLYLRLGVLIVMCTGLVWLAQRIFARAQGNFAQEL